MLVKIYIFSIKLLQKLRVQNGDKDFLLKDITGMSA